ncbi:acyltransferase [Clostridium sp. CF012]|uniref:acyltransferase n=1 Tax=Clostridium sp. CF012 TaxID=2843319 RepID=UPI001C0D29D5|nr:acyltransferase [Clostridium sp. CF012]MBU3142613.1 acyltransferase [Clostridium sp. CF012]
MKTKDKDNYFEIIRGICIICVVLIHSQNGIEYKDSGIYSFNYDYWLIGRQFINFPVAVFVFLTAYFTNITKVTESPLRYYKSRGSRLLIPFLVWSILYSALSVVIGGFNIDIVSILLKIVEGQASTPMYYIVVLMQLVLITPILIRCIGNRYLNLMVFLITPIYLILIYAYSYVTKHQMPLYGTLFPAWLIFYYLGLYIKIKGYPITIKVKPVGKALIIVLGVSLFSIIECYLMIYLGFEDGFASSQIKISSFLYSISIINLILVLKDNHHKTMQNAIVKIGNYSYGIFYVHCFWLLIINVVIVKIPFIHNLLPVYQLTQVTAALALSIACIIVTNKIIGKKLSSKYLGF